MIIAIATVHVHPDKVEEYEAICRELMPEARSENRGALFYNVGKSREDENTFRVVEAYADQESMDSHIANPGLREIISRLMECVADLDVELHDSLD